MRILWTVNTVPPRIAKELSLRSFHAISWVDGMGSKLAKRDDLELAIAFTGDVPELVAKVVEGILYYVLPNHAPLERNWERVLAEYRPDIIHAYGTERTHNISLIRVCKDIPILVSLQGIITEYTKRYYGGLSLGTILKYYTLRDVLLRDGLISAKRKFAAQRKNEQQILNSVTYVEGRSDWDRAMSSRINPALKYYYCPRMIRSPFFQYRWSAEKCHEHSLFVHQGAYPIKGFHIILEAVAILKKKYPDIRLYVSGNNSFELGTLRKRLAITGYVKMIREIISRSNLMENIVFTGYLDSDALAQKMLEASICVIPSAIENAPNALAEAMVLGMPCIASYVGGNAHMLNDGECGLLYRYDEPEVLALRIETLFEQKALAKELADNAYRVARERHDPEKLEAQLLVIYEDVMSDFRRSDRGLD